MVKKNKEYKIKKKVVEINDLSFIRERNHPYGWLKRHYKHHRLRRALKKAEKVIASDHDVATEIVRYYFVSKDKISVK